MAIDIRKFSNGVNSVRSVYQHGHFGVLTFRLLISYPLYFCFLLCILYFQIMDIILYFKIRTRESFQSNGTINSHIHNSKLSQTSNDLSIFDSLPIKKIMVGQTTHFFRSPLAEYIESTLKFTSYFPSVSANKISFFHCFLSLISIRFFSSESLYRRRIGVLIFQLRSFLDCLDGVVFRAHTKTTRYKSYYGNTGYYIDAVSDILGGVCLVIGCVHYFLKQRPSRCQIKTRTTNDGDLTLLNLSVEPLVASNNDALESKGRIYIALGLFACRYSLAAMFWDRDVHAYEDLLDSYTNNPQQQAVQLSILHSPLTILIFYLWRYLSAISMQDYLLFAIFFDRSWEFLQKTHVIGWISLLITVVLTELHISQIRSLFSAL